MRRSWCAAKPAGSWAALTALLMVMKGLPLAYSKDMQDDKPPVFEAHRPARRCHRGDGGDGRDGVTFRTARMRAAARRGLRRRDRPCRLAGAAGQHSVPRGAPHHRPRGQAGRGKGCALDRFPWPICRTIDARIDERRFEKQARPDRAGEPLYRSEERKDDKFDLPPS
jgi:argininosuccinate lyase